MQYYIDGYNVLFRISWKAFGATLQEARDALIREINRHAAILKMQITLVFDAPFSDELSRGHYQNLEIIFTSRGESADEYLIEFLSSVQNPRICTLVTSDKQLALRAKGMRVSVVGVEEWFNSLRRRSHRKTTQFYKAATKSSATVKRSPSPERGKVDLKSEEPTALPHPGDLQSWEKIFEDRFKDFVDE